MLSRFLNKYFFIIFLISPAFMITSTPVSMIPAVLIGLFLYGDDCEGKGEMCAVGETFGIIFILNAIIAYLFTLLLYFYVKKPNREKLILVSIPLAIYFMIAYFIFMSL